MSSKFNLYFEHLKSIHNIEPRFIYYVNKQYYAAECVYNNIPFITKIRLEDMKIYDTDYLGQDIQIRLLFDLNNKIFDYQKYLDLFNNESI